MTTHFRREQEKKKKNKQTNKNNWKLLGRKTSALILLTQKLHLQNTEECMWETLSRT